MRGFVFLLSLLLALVLSSAALPLVDFDVEDGSIPPGAIMDPSLPSSNTTTLNNVLAIDPNDASIVRVYDKPRYQGNHVQFLSQNELENLDKDHAECHELPGNQYTTSILLMLSSIPQGKWGCWLFKNLRCDMQDEKWWVEWSYPSVGQLHKFKYDTLSMKCFRK